MKFTSIVKGFAVLALCIVLVSLVLNKSAEKDFKAFQKEATNAINPHMLQVWAVPIIMTNTNGFEIRNENLPWSVRRIGYPGNVVARVLQIEGANRLYIMWGGGFEAWGLIVCGSNNIVLHEDADTRIVPWTSGVYFFRNKR